MSFATNVFLDRLAHPGLLYGASGSLDGVSG